ncbi:MAG: glycosyltransferase family 39 protein, partial [Anaerolineae bacterium]
MPVLLALVVLPGLVLRLLAAWQPVPVLIEKTLPDDSFYYFAIARNIVAGNGASVDGVTPTNGFHPLWSLVLLAPYALLKDGDAPIHAGLSLAALADALSAVVAFALARRVTGRDSAGLLAAFLYLFNPLAAMESVNGLETSLAMLFFALTSWVYLTRVRRDRATYADYALLGLAAGLMLLARTDTFFLLLLIAGD